MRRPSSVSACARIILSVALSYIVLAGQVAPLALASSESSLRMTPAVVSAAHGLAGDRQGESAAAVPALYLPAGPTLTASMTDNISAGTGVNPGGQINYEVTVANSGSDASNVQFSDTIDLNTTLAGTATMSPLARNDSYNTEQNTPLSVNAAGGVLANDSGIPAPTAQPIASGPTAQTGTVTLNADGSFTYNPPSGFTGSDSFTYTATNSNTPNDTATVTITVVPLDAPPVGVNDSATVNEDAAATAIDVLSNDTDSDGGDKFIASASDPAHGAVVLTGGTPGNHTGLTYQPDPNYNGSDSFTYTLNGGDTATVNVTVAAVNDPPVVMSPTAVTPFAAHANMKVTGLTGLLANVNDNADNNVNGCTSTTFTVDAASISVTSPAGGNITNLNTSAGTFDFNPPPGFTGGPVTFTYQVKDTGCPGPGVNSAPVTVTFSVGGPVIWFVDSAAAVNGDGRLGSPFNLLSNNPGANNDADDVDAANQHIFLYSSATSYTGGLTLNSGETLTGQSAANAATFDALYGITPPANTVARPGIGGAFGKPSIVSTGSNQGVGLVANNGLNSLQFDDTGGNAVNSTANVGTLTLRDIVVNNDAAGNTGGGIVLDDGGSSVTSAGTNTINTLAGQALNVTNTTIGAAGLTFRSLSSNGGTSNGITLDNTGSGPFTVTGNGTAASGGTIQNKNGADGNTAQGIGIYLNSVGGAVSLTRMNIQGCQNYGLRGLTVSGGLTLDNSTVGTTAKHGTSVTTDTDADTAVSGEGSLRFLNLTGTVTFSNDSFDNGFGRTIFIHNNSNGSTLNLSITNSTLRESLNNTNGGSTTGGTTDALFLQANNSATTNLTVTNSRITAYRQFGILTDARDTATMDIDIGNNTFSNDNSGNAGASTSLNFSGSGSSGNDIFVRYNVHNNTFRHGSAAGTPNNGGAHVVSGQVSGGGKFDGKVLNNTFGVSGVPFSGAGNGADVLRLFASGNKSATTRVTGTNETRYLVQGNTIQRYGEVGIQFNARQGNAVLNATVIGNTIREPGTAAAGAFAAIWVNSGALAADTNIVNIVIGSATNAADKNTMQDSDPSNATDVFLDKGTCAGCASQLRLYQNGSDAAGATVEARARDVLVDDNNPTLDLGAGFTGTSPITIVAGTPPQPSGLSTSDGAAVRNKVEMIEGATPAVDTTAPVANPAAPARVWSDMPVIITRTPRSDSVTDEKSDEDEDSAKDEDGSAKDKDAATSDDAAPKSDDAAPKKVRKPVRTKKASDDQPENRNISYLGPLGSAPVRPMSFATASYEVGDAVVTPKRNAPPKTTPKAAPVRAAAPLFSGEAVNVTIGTLPANKSVTIRFSVTVNNPSAVTQVSNQGTVTADGGITVLTDDPGEGGATDPTVTQVNNQISVHDAKVGEPGSGSTNMVFTVSLSLPATGTVTVDFTTATDSGGSNPATAGTDYTTTSGQVTFTAGQQVKTINVPILADAQSPETDETFLVNLSNPALGAAVQDGQATGTITQGNAAGVVLISELRTSGPGGPGDDFVELYNNSDSEVDISGYGLFKKGSGCGSTPVLVATIPGAPGSNTTKIQARGHYLLVGSAYSLKDYGGADAAKGDQTMTADLDTDSNVGLFSTSDLIAISSINRVDAVGFGLNTGEVCDLLREGSTLPAIAAAPTTEHAFFRKMCDFVGGVGCTTPGNPKDTNDNAADLLYADTASTVIAGVPQRLGAPGAENLASPIRRDNSGIGAALLDGTQASAAVPNRLRNGAMGDPNTSTFGTLAIRRRVQNNTAAPVTRLRFRLIEVTTNPVATPGQADLRAITSAAAVISDVNDPATCASTGTPTTAPCQVTAQATTLETPSAQPNGGGYNSTLSLALPSGLAPGASIDVNFLLGIQTTGTFRFYIIVEALP